MTLPKLWQTYADGDYNTSLALATKGVGVEHLHLAGLSLIGSRRQQDGMALLTAALICGPAKACIYANTAVIMAQQGSDDGAARTIEAGLARFPDDIGLLVMKADRLMLQHRLEDAALCYELVLMQDMNNFRAMINLGNIARMTDDFEGAERWFTQAAAIRPDCPDLIYSQTVLYKIMGDAVAAAQVMEPLAHTPDGRFFHAELALARGDYEAGFRLYQARHGAVWYGKPQVTLEPFDHWSASLGKRVAVLPEGGFGDAIQFVRYIPMLAAMAQSVILVTPPSLVRLFRCLHLPSHVVIRSAAQGLERVGTDYVVTILDLPYIFRSSLRNLPAPLPCVPPAAARELRRLQPCPSKRVGLCWAGGAYVRDDHDRRRSFDLATFAPLATVPNVQFVSLQFGPPAAQVCPLLPLLCPLRPSFDFLDTAAVIEQLDLVITVDTAIVHLAATLGKPTWLLSRYDCCWRWLHNRPDSPWYPHVRVFGQRQYGDWSQPIADVAAALRVFCRPA